MKPHQQSQKEHGGDRMKTIVQKEAELILGREVEYVSNQFPKDDARCADCNQLAKYLVVEKNEPSEDEYPQNRNFAWYYCGECMVG